MNARITSGDFVGMRPSHVALIRGDLDVLEFLTNRGAKSIAEF